MFKIIFMFQKAIFIFLLFILYNSLFSQLSNWENNGPFGGYITAIASDPVDTNIVYAGTYGGGIFRSMDSGNNWMPINDGIPVRTDTTIGSPTLPSWWTGDYYPINTIKISPHNPNHVFIGMNGGGVLQSTNCGDNWTLSNIGLTDSAIIRIIWLHPDDSLFVYCGTGYPSGGLYKSINSGNTWSLVDSIPHGSSYYITTINHNPSYPDSIYIGYKGPSWGLYLTPDKGNSWQILNQNIFSFFDLQINPLNAENLWSIVYTGAMEYMLFYSIDGGYSWQAYPDAINPWFEIYGLYVDKNWNMYVIDENYNNNLLRKSTDHGANWLSYPITLPSLPIGIYPGTGPNISANSLNPEIVYFGTNKAVYKSNDGGQSHNIKENGMINSYINEMAVNPKNPQIIYAGGEQGFWKSMDGGNTWNRLGIQDISAVAIDSQHPDTLYWGSDNLYRSFDGGITKNTILTNTIVSTLEIHPDSTNILFVGIYASKLYKSEDWGDNWMLSYSPPHGSFKIQDIAICKKNPDIMYFGTANNWINHGLYKSNNGGNSWTKISDPGQVLSIAIQPTSEDTIFVATLSEIQVSYNGGLSFHNIGQQIPSTNMSKILNVTDNSSFLFAGTKDQGVFYSENSGQSWSFLQGNYNPRITDIDLLLSQNQVFLGTHGSGVWRGNNIYLSIDIQEGKSLIPKTAHLLTPYPNPFNSWVIIPFYVHKKNNVKIDIYNIEGRLVKQILSKLSIPGNHNVSWNGKNENNQVLASGIYFIKLHTNGIQSFRKIIFMK